MSHPQAGGSVLSGCGNSAALFLPSPEEGLGSRDVPLLSFGRVSEAAMV